jgi:hypothetical protein
MEKDIFKFDDFVNGGKLGDLQKMKSKLVKEGFFSDHKGYTNGEDDEPSEEEINQDFNPYKVPSEIEEEYVDIKDFMDDDEFNEDDELEDLDESKSNKEEYYKLFKDKSEDFVCDIAVEGVNQNDTEVRLIVESEDWTLMFVGEIKNGKCIIPIKKLNILNEGQTGNIRLEVNADGNIFIPWEDKFVIKMSKKVTIKLNESKSPSKRVSFLK